MYTIIDIETTGGSARIEKITEIAIYLHDGNQITGEFVSLVNPDRNIPYFITNLTGITNEMGFGLTAVYECIKSSPDNRDIQIILKQYLKNNRVEKIINI